MKKHLLIAALVSLAIPAASASLPNRTVGKGQRTILPEYERSLAMQKPVMYRAKAAESTVATVPFTHTLGKNTEVADYTVIDANGDGRTWKPGGFTSYSVCMAPNDDAYTTSDDWMISVPVQLQAGKTYTISFEEGMTLSRTEDLLEVKIGTEATVEGMTTEVVPVHSILCNDKAFVKYEQQFSVPESGTYHFGFHALSEKAKSGTIKLCNFSVEECAAPIVVPENAVEVPFTHTLGKNTEVTNYTIIDADGDGRTWKPGGFTGYSVCMKPNSDTTSNNDDWMISVPVHLKAATDYTLTYKEGFALSSGKEDMAAIYLGTDSTAEAMTTQIVAPHAVTVRDFTENSGSFSVDTEGYYYIGIHCTSDKTTSGNYKVCDLSVAETSTIVEPAAAGLLDIELAPKGELRATVTYTAPTTTVSGKPLKEISKVVLTTNWAFTREAENVKPGETIVFEDITDIYNGGNNVFKAVAYVGDTEGEPVEIKNVYAGLDNPLPPTGLKIALSDDYKHVTLSWDPVGETGESGGYVDPSKVVYYIFDAFGSYYDPALATTTETSYTLDYSDVTEQDFVAFQVTAGVDETYYSLASTSDIIVVGEPSQLPFYDSFTDGYYQQAWVVDPSSNGTFMQGTFLDNELQTNTDAEEGVEPEYLNSQDGDNGFFLFLPVEPYASYGFYSAKIDISKAANPVYEFYYQGKGSVIDANVSVDGAPFQAAKSIDLKENSTDDWTLCRVDLSEYKSAKYIQIGIMVTGIHNTDESTWSVPVDNIRVIDLKNNAMRVSYSKIPASVKAGENAEVSLTLENIGTEAIASATVELAANGEVLGETKLNAFAPGKIAVASLSVPTSLLSPDVIDVKLTAAAEDTETLAAESAIAVEFPAYLTPENLEAKAEGENVALTWSSIDMAEATKATTRVEDFENPDYMPFTKDDFGGFHFVDGDGDITYSFLNDYDNPYRNAPMAFQLFTPKKSGMPESYYIDCEPHSGETMLVAWSIQGVNDNWLISPELTGDAQTISFWARSFTIAYPESFEVLSSDSDTSTSSFKVLKTVDVASEDWTEYSVDLPAGTKYFAIHHTSNDTYALFVDDMTFETAGLMPSDAELNGYNIYCNSTKLNEAPVAEASYLHANAVGHNAYRVSAVYSVGESRPSSEVVVDITTGISNVSGTAATITCNGSLLTVQAAADTVVTVCAPDGRLILKGTVAADGEFSAELPAGVNIVSAGTATAKVIAK